MLIPNPTFINQNPLPQVMSLVDTLQTEKKLSLKFKTIDYIIPFYGMVTAVNRNPPQKKGIIPAKMYLQAAAFSFWQTLYSTATIGTVLFGKDFWKGVYETVEMLMK